MTTRRANTNKKHEKIRALFKERYTNQPRVNGVKKYTKEYIIAIIASEFFLSMRSVENIVYSKSIAIESAQAEPVALNQAA